MCRFTETSHSERLDNLKTVWETKKSLAHCKSASENADTESQSRSPQSRLHVFTKMMENEMGIGVGVGGDAEFKVSASM